jgi:hypothetical protein
MPSHRTDEQRQKDFEALRLKREHLSWEQIARRMGWSQGSVAARAVSRALSEVPTQDIEEVRKVEIERLDELAMRAKVIMLRRHYAISANGRAAVHPETGEVLEDDGPSLQALDRLLRIQERRARLLGLDAAQKYEVRTVDDLDARLSALAEQLAANDPVPETGVPVDAGQGGEAPPAGAAGDGSAADSTA